MVFPNTGCLLSGANSHKGLKQSPSDASMDEGFLDYPHLRQHYQKVKYQGQLCVAPIWVPF